jgi:hypothetical protein
MPLYVPQVQSAGVSGGNTSGNSGLRAGSIALAGGNNVTLSQATNATGATITVSGAAGGSMGISTQGNTAGTTGFFSNSYQLAATNLVTLSQSTNASGGSMTIVGPRVPGMTRYGNMDWGGTVAPYTSLGTVNGSMLLFPMNDEVDVFPGNMTASTLFIDMVGSSFTSASAAQTLRVSAGIYTLAGASSLSLLNSGTASVTQGAATANTSLWHGPRYLTMVDTQFSGSSLTFSQTSYWLGLIFSSSAVTQSLSLVGGYRAMTASARSGTIGVAGATANSRGWSPWAGVVNTAALPTSIHMSGVIKTGVSGGFIPHFVLEALHSAW